MLIPPSGPGVRTAPPLFVWWIIWGALLLGLVIIWFGAGFLKLLGNEPHANPMIDLVGMVPLFLSIILRWLVLPRACELRPVFVLFILGLTLADACGIMGTFLGGPYRDELFLLGVLGIAQYMPFFVRGLQQPKPQGFIPNN